jgi:hypothetical protein
LLPGDDGTRGPIMRLGDLVDELSSACSAANHRSDQHWQQRLQSEFFNDDGTPVTRLIGLPQADGTLQARAVPIISLLPPRGLQVGRLRLGLRAHLTGPHGCGEDLEPTANHQVLLGGDSGSEGLPVYIEIHVSCAPSGSASPEVSVTVSPLDARPGT